MKTRIDGSLEEDKFVHSFNAVQVRDDFIRSQKRNAPWLIIVLAVLVIIIIILAALIGAI